MACPPPNHRLCWIVLKHHGYSEAAQVLGFAWLGFCLYTWTAPALFLKSVRREMEEVRLRPGF